MTQALYRRYRPATFAEVIGQEHVTEPLQQALRNDRVHHAYLFSGPRGCGKTTSARILARCLNCEQGPTPTPCGVCDSCRSLVGGGPASLDVIEIDAASHGGVDDARDLRDKAFFSPASSRFKIYIVDEAHMVSPAGFNALLKVVEEPPEHVKFIFATTEPDKVIGTIRSRTHHYPFRLVPPARLQAYLGELCEREGVQVERGVLPMVVRAGKGSVRDALSVLDQLMGGAGDAGVTRALASSLLGYTDAPLLDATVDAFATHDRSTVFTVVDSVIEGGLDPRRFAEDLLERLRDLIILSAVPDARSTLLAHLPDDQLDQMAGQALRFGAAELSRAADIVNTGLTEMRGTTAPRLQLELVCARVLLPGASGDEASLAARLERMERRLAGSGSVAVPVAVPVVVPAPAATVAPGARPVPATLAPVVPPSQPAAEAVVEALEAAREVLDEARAIPEEIRRAETQGPEIQGPGAQGPEAQGPEAPGAAAQGATATPAPAAVSPDAHDLAGVRAMWSVVLGTLASLKRTTWSLVATQASVVEVGSGRLVLGFPTAGLRDRFAGRPDHEEYVRQALLQVLDLDVSVQAVVSGPGDQTAPRAEHVPVAQSAPPPGPPIVPVVREAAHREAPQRQAPAPRPAAARGHGDAAAGGATRARSRQDGRDGQEAAPQRVAPEHDDPQPDDPDLEDSGLSGVELLARDLGAKVIDEYDTA